MQAKAYPKIKVQGNIRMLGRAISYILEVICFVGVCLLYQYNRQTTVGNIVALILTFAYSFLIQDQLNGIMQIILVCLVCPRKEKVRGCAKFLKHLILKEVWGLFTIYKPTANISINDKQSAKITPMNTNNDVYVNTNANLKTITMTNEPLTITEGDVPLGLNTIVVRKRKDT